MLRFSANLGFLWSDLPLLERVERAAQAGFQAIELHWPYDTPPEQLREACARLGLTLLGINTVPGDPSKGERGLGALVGREADFAAAIDQSLQYCLASGAKSVHAMAGNVELAHWDEAREVFKKNLTLAAKKAEDAGLMLLLEPLNRRAAPEYFYSTVGEAVEIINEIGSKSLRLMFDMHHVGVAEGDVITKLRQHLDVIGHIQIAAVPSRAEPDEGEVDYAAIFRELEALKYDGFIGCEYMPRAGVEEGLVWVKKLGVSL